MEECDFTNVAYCRPLLYSQWLKHADADLLRVWMTFSPWCWGGGGGGAHWCVYSELPPLALLQVSVCLSAATESCYLQYVQQRVNHGGLCYYQKKEGEAGAKCETKTTSPTTFIIPLSWPHCPCSSQCWRVSDIIYILCDCGLAEGRPV